MGVSHICGCCSRPASVIINRRHLCSSHALEATLDRLELTVDLRRDDIELAIGDAAEDLGETVSA